MLNLLTTFSQGSSYDNAFEEVYGFDMDGLNDLWQKYIIAKYQTTSDIDIPATSDFISELLSGLRVLVGI